MEWNDNFNIGVASIDAQHKELVYILKYLQKSIKGNQSQYVFANTIRALVEYTKIHFTDEERFMESIGFPQLGEHKEIHQTLIQEVKHILLRLKRRENIKPIELMRFLNDWVTKHIMNEDQLIGKFVLDETRRAVGNEIIDLTHEEIGNLEYTTKLQALTELYNQQAIPFNEYQKKCCDLILTYCNPKSINNHDDLGRALSSVENLSNNSYIHNDVCEALKRYIITHVSMNEILESFANSKAQLTFLNSMREYNLLSPADHSRYKETITKTV